MAVKRKYPIVEVEWVDSVSICDRPWHSLEEVLEMVPPLSLSVGYLIHDSESHVVLVGSFGETEVSGDIVIPRGCIQKITILRKANAKRK